MNANEFTRHMFMFWAAVNAVLAMVTMSGASLFIAIGFAYLSLVVLRDHPDWPN